jgi:hypothetical protein
VLAAEEIPGVPEDDMSTQNSQRKHGTTRGLPRRQRQEQGRTAMATRISRLAAKSGCAREWGGWGRISEDGSGQNNPNRNEDPWGRAGRPLERRCTDAPRPSTQNEEPDAPGEEHEGWRQTARREDLVVDGKAPSEIPALKP